MLSSLLYYHSGQTIVWAAICNLSVEINSLQKLSSKVQPVLWLHFVN